MCETRRSSLGALLSFSDGFVLSAFPDICACFVLLHADKCECPVTDDLFPSTVRHMTDNRKSGFALIAGSVGGIVTMAIHPTSAGVLTPAQFERLATVSAIAHSLAIASFVIMLLGAIGLSMRLAASDRLAFSGMVVFAVGACCDFDRRVGERLYRPEHYEANDQRRAGSRTAMAYRGCRNLSNQPGIRLDLHGRRFSCDRTLVNLRPAERRHLRGIAIYGCVIAPVIVLAICSGHLRLERPWHGHRGLQPGHLVYRRWNSALARNARYATDAG